MPAVSGLQISSWFTVNGLLPELSSCALETGELLQFILQICIISLFFLLCLYLFPTICPFTQWFLCVYLR